MAKRSNLRSSLILAGGLAILLALVAPIAQVYYGSFYVGSNEVANNIVLSPIDLLGVFFFIAAVFFIEYFLFLIIVKFLLKVTYSPIARDMSYVGLALAVIISVPIVFTTFKPEPYAGIGMVLAPILTLIILALTLLCVAVIAGTSRLSKRNKRN